MASLLTGISITFTSHTPKDPNTVLHVFVKNRKSDSSTPESDTTYISNYLAWLKYAKSDETLVANNPYLAYAENFASGVAFAAGQTYQAAVPLRPRQITTDELVLPAVNIHLLPYLGPDPTTDLSSTWAFDYTISFQFKDATYNFDCPSNLNGVTGIVLDKDNRDYSGICTEVPGAPPPQPLGQDVNSYLTAVDVTFHTHSGQDKASDTKLNLHIFDRRGASYADIVFAEDLAPNTAFTGDSALTYTFGPGSLLLASGIRLQDMVLPGANITISPTGSNTWKFDYQVTYWFSYVSDDVAFQNYALRYISTTSGIVLNESFRTHTGVHRGDSFPTSVPVGAKLALAPINHALPPKIISLDLLKNKLNEFVNSRQGQDPDSVAPTLRKIRLDHTPPFGIADPASYYNVLSIDADPLPPGQVPGAGYRELVKWDDSASDLGPLSNSLLGNLYFNNINSDSITATVDATQPTPLVLTVKFGIDPNGPDEVQGDVALEMKFKDFSITAQLTLNFDAKRNRVDLMSWVGELEDPNNLTFTPPIAAPGAQGTVAGTLLGRPVSIPALSLDEGIGKLKDQVLLVALTTTDATDLGGTLRQKIRDEIYSTLATPDKFTGQSGRDDLNAFLNSWLLGGVIADSHYYQGAVPGNNECKVLQSVIDVANNNLDISYTGPQYTYQFATPPDWPAGHDFTPGTLSSIDHIVVLMMENRSFDHMLGYLSVPVQSGGMGRTDIDGLTGTESNPMNGGTVKSMAFAAGDTVFSPDPPHDFVPVGKAINVTNGVAKMDGFAQAYADAYGPTVGPNIMKYHTADNVPVYDALARDFAICQRWFAPHPGPTFCNRFHTLTGRLNVDPYGFWEFNQTATLRPVFTPTIFDHLNERSVSWKYFETGYCYIRFFEEYTFNNTNIFTFDDPGLGFLNVAAAGELPSVTFIDPHFIENPPDGNCDGPPADVHQGQLFVQKVVEAVVTSPKWSSTMLIITYDEHGGFYDHVPPPAAVQIAPGLPTTTGVRVPTFIISPWVTGGMVFGADGNVFDHTSILKTIAKRFLSPDLSTNAQPPFMGPRYAAANDLSSVMGSSLRPSLFLPFIAYNLLFNASGKRMSVRNGDVSPGALLEQDDAAAPTDTAANDAQQFSFESAGGDYYYIRTHTGRLYLTVDVPASGPVSGQPLALKQDVKYPPTGTGSQLPDYQKWKFPTVFGTSPDGKTFLIANAGISGMALEPQGASLVSGAAIVLNPDVGTDIEATGKAFSWEITSPLLTGAGTILPTPPPPPSALTCAPLSLSFPPKQVGDLATFESDHVTLTVTGSQQLVISSIALLSDTGAAGDFTCVPPVGSPPPPATLNVQNGQLTITVSFWPTAAGARNAQLQVVHNLSTTPLVIPLAGTGVAAPVPLLTLSTTGLFFTNPKVPVQTVMLTNTGTAPLTITGMTIQDSNFSVTNTCGGTVAPGQKCTISVRCAFQGAGGSSELVIAHIDASGSPTTTNIDLSAVSKKGPPE